MFKKLLPDSWVQWLYVRSGLTVGDALSYSYMGEPVGFKKMLRRWQKWEAEYARRGYRTTSLDEFISAGGYGTALEDVGQKRIGHEKPVFHARICTERFLGNIEPVIDTSNPEPQQGTYVLPSTKDAESRSS